MEAQSIANIVKDAAGKDADDVMFGVNINDELEDRIEDTIIANNFVDEVERTEAFINVQSQQRVVTSATPRASHTEKPKVADIDLPPWIRS